MHPTMDNFKELEAKAVAAWTQSAPERQTKRDHEYKLYRDTIANAVATAIAKEGPGCQVAVHGVAFNATFLEKLKAELKDQGYTFMYQIAPINFKVCIDQELPKPDPKGFENVA